MGRSAEYKCRHCQRVEWVEVGYGEDLPEAVRHYCHVVEGHWPMLRRYSAPHTGTGSSGERPK